MEGVVWEIFEKTESLNDSLYKKSTSEIYHFVYVWEY